MQSHKVQHTSLPLYKWFQRPTRSKLLKINDFTFLKSDLAKLNSANLELIDISNFNDFLSFDAREVTQFPHAWFKGNKKSARTADCLQLSLSFDVILRQSSCLIQHQMLLCMHILYTLTLGQLYLVRAITTIPITSNCVCWTHHHKSHFLTNASNHNSQREKSRQIVTSQTSLNKTFVYRKRYKTPWQT